MKNTYFRMGLMACTAISVVSLQPGMALAQDAATASATELQTITVKTTKKTARQKLEKGAADTPFTSETTAEELRKKDIGSISDLAASSEPGVDFDQTKPGKPGGLYIRGLGGARVVTLVDGIPIPYFENFARNDQATTSLSDPNSSFDFSSLSTVDVVRGADSSKAGSGALGGALVLRTLEPEDLIEDGRDWGAVVKTTFDSADKGLGGSLAAAKKLGNTSVLFQGSYRYSNEMSSKGNADVLGTKRSKANPADTHLSNLLFKVRQDIEGGHRIGLTAERYESNTDTDLKTLWANYKPGYTGWDDTLRERVSLDYSYEALSEDTLIEAAKLTAYWQRLSKASGSYGLSNANVPYGREDSYRQGAFGLNGGITAGFETGILDHAVSFGGNFEAFGFKEYLDALGTSATASYAYIPKVHGSRLGLYLEDGITVGDTGFKVTPGIRFDWFNFEPQAAVGSNPGYPAFGVPTSRDGNRFSPKLLLEYELTPELGLFAQWSTAYRAPTTNELYLNFSNTAFGYAVLGNADLLPETSNGFEIGANYEAGDLKGRVTLFYNHYKNFIEQYASRYNLPGPPVQNGTLNTYRNRANVEIAGVEVKARKDFVNGVFIHGSLAYAYGRDVDTDELIRTVAPFKTVAGIGYDQETWGTELTGIFSAGMHTDFKANTYEAPAYGIANLTGWWAPEQFKGLRLQAGVYNIFDKKYWNAVGVRDVNPLSQAQTNQPVDFYSEAGRTFKISLTKKF